MANFMTRTIFLIGYLTKLEATFVILKVPTVYLDTDLVLTSNHMSLLIRTLQS